MGTCISKCKPKKTSHKNDSKLQKECKCKCIDDQNNSTNLVQDKIVISQVPISSPKSPLSPSKMSTNSSSCTNSNYPTTSSSSSSCSLVSSASSLVSYSSVSTVNSKSGSYPKENAQLIRPDYLPIKVNANSKRSSSLPTKSHISGKNPNVPKQLLPSPSPQKLTRPLPQKRPRCSSPSNLTRQKSFRRESEPESESNNKLVSISGPYTRPISPTPSRRFTRESTISQSRNYTNSMRRENNCYVRPPSPRRINGSNSRRYSRSNNNINNNNNLIIKNSNEDGIKMVNSKIQELAIGGLCTQDIDMMAIEDAENPHIALDCFIFL